MGGDCGGAREGRQAVCRSGSDMPDIPMSPKREPGGVRPSCFPGLIQCHLDKQGLSEELCHKLAMCWNDMGILSAVRSSIY